MNAVDGSEHYEKASQEQSPSLLTIILDTHPAAWSLLSDTITLSGALANLLVFINAHLACNYTNKVAVIASHCTQAKWLYPTITNQHVDHPPHGQRKTTTDPPSTQDQLAEPTNRLQLNSPKSESSASAAHKPRSDKYRPFRLVEEELLHNLTNLLASTTPDDVANNTSTKIAGALTLALSYINRETIAYAESTHGVSSAAPDTTSTQPTNPDGTPATTGTLQSRIFLLTVAPTTDLAHQYIPIMNTIFACQRLAIPIDICQLQLPSTLPNSTTPQTSTMSLSSSSSSSSSSPSSSSATVFLQQASDATKGIYISIPPLATSTSPSTSISLLTTLLTAFLPPHPSRMHLILPTSISVDFRAACFCHRTVISLGWVCSICLSIFCHVLEDGVCLTCGTQLTVAGLGGRPVVVSTGKNGGKKRKVRMG